jgi:hypothetical protein
VRFILPSPDPETELVLQQLHRQDLEAVLRGDKLTVTIARLLWGETYLSAYGLNHDALPILSATAEQLFPESAGHSPVWRHFLEGRPLVAVVERRERFVNFGWKQKAKWYDEQLACGHTLSVPADLFGATPPKRRRCKACGESVAATGVKVG